MKIAGFLQLLEKFNTTFSLRLAHTFLYAAEQVYFVFQKKTYPYQMLYLQLMQQKPTIVGCDQRKNSVAFLMQQCKLQRSIILESQKYQDIDVIHHDLNMEVDLIRFHLLERTITTLSMKFVIFYLFVQLKTGLLTSFFFLYW